MVIGIAHLQPIVALIAGILILVISRLLNFIVAVYMILIGVIGLGLIRWPERRACIAVPESAFKGHRPAPPFF
jgi:Protein of unknown function (DUF3096)